MFDRHFWIKSKARERSSVALLESSRPAATKKNRELALGLLTNSSHQIQRKGKISDIDFESSTDTDAGNCLR